jgi:hypothetical protein
MHYHSSDHFKSLLLFGHVHFDDCHQGMGKVNVAFNEVPVLPGHAEEGLHLC